MREHNFTLIDATESYYGKIKSLCDEAFGEGYIDRSEYEKWMCHPKLFNIALVEGEFAGYSVMIPAGTEDIMQQMDMKKAEVLKITGDKPALIYKSVAVCPKYRKNGLLEQLIKGMIVNARKLDYSSVILSAWTYDNKIPAEKSLISLGFTRLDVRHMLWYQNESYQCVICNGRCSCDAVIFYKILKGEHG